MNMADAIPVILVLLFALVTGLTVLMVWFVARLKRRDTLELRPVSFVPGDSAAVPNMDLFSHGERTRRPRRVPVSDCQRGRFNRTALRLRARRR